MSEALIQSWRDEEREQPEGWSFASLADRMTESAEPWDVDAAYRSALHGARRVLDMGTGGGEHLLTFAHLLPADTTATEGWPPNVAVAREALAPHGIAVVEYGAPDQDVDAIPMPFDEDRFDLVLNRHESFSPRELARVIAPGGRFLTQQVGGDECGELAEWLGAHDDMPHVNLAQFRRDLEEVGFEIEEAGEHVGSYVFVDVAALVAYPTRALGDAGRLQRGCLRRPTARGAPPDPRWSGAADPKAVLAECAEVAAWARGPSPLIDRPTTP